MLSNCWDCYWPPPAPAQSPWSLNLVQIVITEHIFGWSPVLPYGEGGGAGMWYVGEAIVGNWTRTLVAETMKNRHFSWCRSYRWLFYYSTSDCVREWFLCSIEKKRWRYEAEKVHKKQDNKCTLSNQVKKSVHLVWYEEFAKLRRANNTEWSSLLLNIIIFIIIIIVATCFVFRIWNIFMWEALELERRGGRHQTLLQQPIEQTNVPKNATHWINNDDGRSRSNSGSKTKRPPIFWVELLSSAPSSPTTASTPQWR